MNWTAIALISAGSGAILLSSAAERYHSTKFRKHTDRLESINSDQEIVEEVQRFHEDRMVDISVEVMFWGNILGIGLLALGLFMLIL